LVAVAPQAFADPLCANKQQAAVVASAARQSEASATEAQVVTLPDETQGEVKTAQAVE
jgi:hypothetical protein